MCKLWSLFQFFDFCKLIKHVHYTNLYTRTRFKITHKQKKLFNKWLFKICVSILGMFTPSTLLDGVKIIYHLTNSNIYTYLYCLVRLKSSLFFELLIFQTSYLFKTFFQALGKHIRRGLIPIFVKPSNCLNQFLLPLSG